MTDVVIVAILSLIGTLIGSWLSSNKIQALIEYRMGELEKKVDNLEAKQDKHNQVIERTYKLEGRMDEAEHDIRDLKAR
jgi:hypothetical protein